MTCQQRLAITTDPSGLRAAGSRVRRTMPGALPLLTVPMSSRRWTGRRDVRHKSLVDGRWCREILSQIGR